MITYSAAVSACEKGQKPQQALHLLQELQLRGLLPNVITYNAAVSACEKGHKPQQALHLVPAPRPPAGRHRLQRLDQCLREGYAAAESP